MLTHEDLKEVSNEMQRGGASVSSAPHLVHEIEEVIQDVMCVCAPACCALVKRIFLSYTQMHGLNTKTFPGRSTGSVWPSSRSPSKVALAIVLARTMHTQTRTEHIYVGMLP